MKQLYNHSKKLITLVILLLNIRGYAQDLNARVKVLSPQIQSSNKSALNSLETAIRDFLNSRKWSSDTYLSQERIECSFIFNITAWDGSNGFTADVQIQSSRPVYASSYNSTLLVFSDKELQFSYTEGQPIDFSDQNYTSNISSLLAFYAYMIIGIDHDSFSLQGGSSDYAKASDVTNYAQGGEAPKGWAAADGSRTRYWLLENFTNKNYSPFRNLLYTYHRKGLDLMSSNSKQAREEIINGLASIQKMDRQRQSSIATEMFFTSKVDELVGIFSQSPAPERKKIYDILVKIDPSRIGKYESLIQ